MVAVVLAHIAGMPVEETLLSVGPALVAAVSVGLVHIRSLRDRPTSAEDSPAGQAPPPAADTRDDGPDSAAQAERRADGRPEILERSDGEVVADRVGGVWQE